MSRWANVWSKYGNEVHTVPMDPKRLPCKELRTAAYGHVLLIACPCKPSVVLEADSNVVFVNHRDAQRGGCTECGETYQ